MGLPSPCSLKSRMAGPTEPSQSPLTRPAVWARVVASAAYSVGGTGSGRGMM